MKILPTIGPATNKIKDLNFIFKYCSMARLNSSHNNIDWHKKTISQIKKIDQKINILVDIPGIKPRTNNKEDVKLKKNEIITFGYNFKNGHKNYIKLTRKLPKKKGGNNHYFSLDDGKINFKIIKFNTHMISGKALDDCVIKPKKGLNIPNSIYDDNAQKKIYIEYLNKFKKTKFDAVGLSFVQSKELIIYLKKKFPQILIVSKIENSEGLKNAKDICKYSDAVMID